MKEKHFQQLILNPPIADMGIKMKRLKNFNEDWVKIYLDRHISSFGVCTCESCRLDIMAIALNKLPPQYVVTEREEAYASMSEMSQQRMIDIVTVITEAVMIVQSRPSH